MALNINVKSQDAGSRLDEQAIKRQAIIEQAQSGKSQIQSQLEANGIVPTIAPSQVTDNLTPVPSIAPTPARTEGVPELNAYTQSVGNTVAERGLTLDDMNKRVNDQSFESYQKGDRDRFSHMDPDTGQPVFTSVTEEDFTKDADKLALPSPDAILDVNQFKDTSKYKSAYQHSERDGQEVFDRLEHFEDWVIPHYENDVEFKRILDNTGVADLGQFASLASLANAGILNAQSSYVAGKNVSDIGSIFEAEGASYTADAVDHPAQLGVTEKGYVMAAQRRFKDLARRAKVTSNLTPRDYQLLGTKLLEYSLDSGQIKTTKIGGKKFYIPNGNHTGTKLGTQSDHLIGAELQNPVSDSPTTGGDAIQKGRALKKSRKTQGNNIIEQATVELAKDTMGHMAYGMDKMVSTAIMVQIIDVITNLKFTDPNTTGDPKEALTYSTSEFAKMFKLDSATAEASYNTKLFNSISDTLEQKKSIAIAVNRITATRQDEILNNLNKQLMLIKKSKSGEEGYAEANRAFYYAFSSSDINGRIANASHNGNYTLDKVVARQTQGAKINPRINVTKSSFLSKNESINSKAKSLFQHEGNPTAFGKALNSLDAATEAEISFRVVLVKNLLHDASEGFKKAGLSGAESITQSQSDAMAFVQEAGLKSLSNVSNKALYETYVKINSASPTTLIQHFAVQGRALKTQLSGTSNFIEDLPVIEFDPLERVSERADKAVDAWGDFTIPDMSALKEFANVRGETRAKMSIRADALKYMDAMNGQGPSNFELEFEVELDATQSGAFLQALIAPSEKSQKILNSLGFETNVTGGDLRDVAKEILLEGNVNLKDTTDPEVTAAWDGFISNALTGEKSGIAREFLLKQPIMQFFYGKPASMFGDLSNELLGWFSDEINNSPILSGISPADRSVAVKGIIEKMLSSPQFDASYAQIMKKVGRFLAVTDSDLIIEGPMGNINLSVESVVASMKEIAGQDPNADLKQLELDILDIFDRDGEKIEYLVTSNSTTTGGPKQGRHYDSSKPAEGNNFRTGPGKRLTDSLGVLVIHQLDNAIMNHTVNVVNKDRPRNNPYPAKIIYDAIIPNAAGYLRYSHVYNNESIPLAQKFNIYRSIQKAAAKGLAKTQRDVAKSGHVNISVIESPDGNVRGVERHAVLTQYLDDYEINKPKRVDYPNQASWNRAMSKYDSRKTITPLKLEVNTAKSMGYIPPIINEQFLEFGVISDEQPMVTNARERANMFIKSVDYISLVNRWHRRMEVELDSMAEVSEREKKEIKIKGTIAHLT